MKTLRRSLLLILISFSAHAKLPAYNVPEKQAEIRHRAAGLISQSTHKKMLRVHGYLRKEKYDDAIRLLKKIEQSVTSRPAELAQVYQNMGFVYGQKGDEKKALVAFEKALALKALPYGPTLNSMYTRAQLLMSLGQTDKAVTAILEWFAVVDSPRADAYILLASAYASRGKKVLALEHVEEALRLSSEPKKSWLQFAVALNYELDNFKKAAHYLERLTAQYPEDRKHWTQLAGLYMNLDNSAKALAAMELTHKWAKLDKESEVLSLVSLYLNRGIPYWGALALEDGLERKVVKPSKKSLQLLAQCYLQAEEIDKAMAPLAKAAKMGADSQLYTLQGQLHLEKENWKAAVSSFKMGIKGAKKDRLGSIHLGLGMALHKLGQTEEALSAFLVAKHHKETKKAADQWINHIAVGQQ